MKKTIKVCVLEMKTCSNCPNRSLWYCAIGYKDIPNHHEIPDWCPLPNYNEEITDDFLYELSLTDEDRKKMRQIAKNPDGSNKTLKQLFHGGKK